jgi:hypothetical protein
MYPDLGLDDLKGEMRDIAQVIGIEAVVELCGLFGGDNIYIPLDVEEKAKKTGDIKEMIEAIGEEKYQLLRFYYGGTNIYFQKKENLLKNYIEKKVKEEYNGDNRRKLMQKYNISKVRFYNIINGNSGSCRIKSNDNQLTLFDLI